MNGTGLFLVALLIVVLIAVAFGSSQIQADLTSQIAQITSQRDTTLQLALEAKGQRDAAFQERDVAFTDRDKAIAELAKANGRIASLEVDLNKTAQDLSSTQRTAEVQRMELKRLQNQIIALQSTLEQAQVDVPSVPVTGGVTSWLANLPQVAENSQKAIRRPVQASMFYNQLGIGLAVLIGMMVLGSGGFIVYRHDPNRKYTVKMTKDQIREYARYQRERGNQAR
jgi:hypothetical protein